MMAAVLIDWNRMAECAMDRRSFITGVLAMPALAGLSGSRVAAQGDAGEPLSPDQSAWRVEALAAFPYEYVRVDGRAALREWEWLKAGGRGAPVVIGGDEDFEAILQVFHPDYVAQMNPPALADTLARADALAHPADLLALHRLQEEEILAALERMCRQDPDMCGALDALSASSDGDGPQDDAPYEPPVGDWPLILPEPDTALTVAEELLTGRALERVTIVLVPTDDPTTIPAHLRWGGWNANPPAEYHVAALRSWRDRYGAELVGLGFDVMNLRVARRPASRDEALALAREQYAYCSDIVDQGVGTLAALAALLMAGDWWYFWWD